MDKRGSHLLAHLPASRPDTQQVPVSMPLGILIDKAGRGISKIVAVIRMNKLKKIAKAGVIAGVCGIGLCAVSRKLKLTTRIAEFTQSIEAVPFPGTRFYLFLASRHLRPLYTAIAEQIVAEDGFEKILDLGTNAGYLPLEIAERAPDVSISGIDESQEMIRLALSNARASRAGSSVDFSRGDPECLPFPGRHFDLIVAVNVLHHWRHPRAIFQEAYHVLKSGGEFRIYDYRHDIPPEVWDSLGSDLPLLLKAPLLFGPVASSRVAYGEDKLLELAEQTRFENISIEKITLPLFGRDMPVFNLLKMRKPRHE